jgi:zinc transporter
MGPIVYGYHMNHLGKAIQIKTLPKVVEEETYCWFHLDASDDVAADWLASNTSMPDVARDMMLSKNTRPNVVRFPGGYLITLRAVNKMEIEDAEAFNAINVWIGRDHIVTARSIKILAIEDIVESIGSGEGPNSMGVFLVDLIHHLQKRINQLVSEIEDEVEDLEDQVLNKEYKNIRHDLINLRKKVAQVRKYILPQRETLHALAYDRFEFLKEDEKLSLIYDYDKMIRLTEALDIAKEHLLLSQEEVVNSQNDLMNRSMYRISIISGLFLPLGFITGLLGVNIGGVPGIENTHAFIILSGFSALYLLVTAVYFVWQKKI